MLFPLVGLLLSSFALWGTWIHVPGIMETSEGFVGTLSHAMQTTNLAKGVHELVEAFSTYTLPWHEEAVYVPAVVQSGCEDRVDYPTRTEPTILSEDDPLWEEAEESSPDGPSAFLSPESLCVALIVAWGPVAFIQFLWGGFARSDASTLEGPFEAPLEGLFLQDVPKAAYCLVANGAPSLYEVMDALVNRKNSPSDKNNHSCSSEAIDVPSAGSELIAVLWRAQQVSSSNVTLLRAVGDALTRLERRQVLAFDSHELDSRIIQEAEDTDHPNGGVDNLTTPAPDAADVTDCAVPRLSRQYALVVRRPENLDPFLVLRCAFALLESWQRQTVGHEAGADAASTPAQGGGTGSGPKRRNRPSQAKRRRRAKMALVDR
ncbi:hypothetical protein ASPZODRAFT_138439 [Penicilliopsis zonata CBS 506.65]|uniref:GPI-anchored surface protein n=1 Tax=Penicilliopsis zonata CBS 506.65 TaxID=1073090 RepID=A0A1L9SVY3_9EURO|nr:hypothetical protein ASPZODRAFT_138439 [Penicilliopsis zonata CBS 506.65]OJJ51336.1 hypothetical protein ASPZODRAFT_138439 [Penicilliopsis zonata CBS 506.65]